MNPNSQTVVLPVEPTREMLSALMGNPLVLAASYEMAGRAAYAAMLKAAPQQAGPEGDGWNAGIEAAAKLVDEKHDPCEPWLTGDEVRALKRPEAGAEPQWTPTYQGDNIWTGAVPPCWLLVNDVLHPENEPWVTYWDGQGYPLQSNHYRVIGYYRTPLPPTKRSATDRDGGSNG